MTTLLIGIEGAATGTAFCKDVLLPYARAALPGFVRQHGHDPEVRRRLDRVAIDIAAAACQDAVIVETLQGWIDQGIEHAALKALLDRVWEAGFRHGDLIAPLPPDVAPALRAWHAAGQSLAAYSALPATTQQLFFSHTDAGDLTPLFAAFFDPGTGDPRAAASYAAIAARLACRPGSLRFLSGVVEELDAARAAGLHTVLIDRVADPPHPRSGEAAHGHPRVENFAESW